MTMSSQLLRIGASDFCSSIFVYRHVNRRVTSLFCRNHSNYPVSMHRLPQSASHSKFDAVTDEVGLTIEACSVLFNIRDERQLKQRSEGVCRKDMSRNELQPHPLAKKIQCIQACVRQCSTLKLSESISLCRLMRQALLSQICDIDVDKELSTTGWLCSE